MSRLSDIPDSEFSDLKQQGIDIVWMMGVWELGSYGLRHDRTDPALLAYYPTVLQGFTLQDVIGSPYAIVDYVTNPELGSDSDLKALRSRLNSMGLKLMLDFVPNHSAVDCPWTTSDPTYYIRAPQSNPPYDPSRYLASGIAYGYSGYGGAWTDTAQFNYWNMDFRKEITQQLMAVASFSDYIRCDMAYLCLNDVIKSIWANQMTFWGYQQPSTEFWRDAISQVKSSYDVKFLAEVYSPWQDQLQQVGFDFTYDKSLYDRLGSGNLDDIRNYVKSTPAYYTEHSAHFVENHDEPRAAAFFGSNSRADAANSVVMTLPGMRFYFEGQENGYFNKLDVHLRRATPEPSHPGVAKYYSLFIQQISQPIFHSGSWNYRDIQGSGDSWRLLAWEWVYNNEKVLVVVNYSDQSGSGAIPCPLAEPVNGNDSIPVTELLTGTVYQRSAKEMASTGLFVVVDSWSTQMFQYY